MSRLQAIKKIQPETSDLGTEATQYDDLVRRFLLRGRTIDVRFVNGYEGIHVADTAQDLVIVGAGYDDELIRQVIENKKNARKVYLFGLPSLTADMYQENVLRAGKAIEDLQQLIHDTDSVIYAPANDPFVVAQKLSKTVEKIGPANLYLSPLATKAQALGFVLYFIWECRGRSVSMLYPFTDEHEKQTSQGLHRTWLYELELPNQSSIEIL